MCKVLLKLHPTHNCMTHAVSFEAVTYRVASSSQLFQGDVILDRIALCCAPSICLLGLNYCNVFRISFLQTEHLLDNCLKARAADRAVIIAFFPVALPTTPCM